MAPTKAPTNEIGVGSSVGTLTWGNFLDDTERVPELQWPRSIKEYDRMRNDSQVAALLAGSHLPITRYRWEIDPNGAATAVVDRMSEDFGLPVKGSEAEVDDTDNNFDHGDCLRHGLLARVFGHNFGELYGEVDDDGWWRCKKVAPRMPATIAKIEVTPDGALKGVRQNITRDAARVAPLIDADRLVAFVWDREGSQWTGRSVLRPLYGNWLIKQRLMRVDATKHERNGMGVPIAKATQESVGKRALAIAAKMATRLRVGQNAGGALPYGMDIDLKGVQGNLPDTLASIKYHDEAMARALLMMFIQLGQTETGSRALGESFVDFFALALEAIAEWYAKTMTKHVFRKWVIWNVGRDSSTPKLTFVPGPRELATADLKNLIDSGAITVDPELEAWIRGKHGMPAKGTTVPTATPPVEPTGQATTAKPAERTYGKKVSGEARRVFANGDGSIPLPDRTLRRQPMDFEVQAAVDFATIDAEFESAVSTLVNGWQDVRTGHINELVDLIAATDPGDLDALSNIAAAPGEGVTLLEDVMHDVAEKGAAGAVQEAKAQGKTAASLPVLDDLKTQLSARAASIDTLLARSISEAAARKAASLAGGALGADDIANEVRNYLTGLSDAYLEEQFTGAVSQAQNSGRRAVLLQETPESVYASELLDKNTCSNCKSVDGREYDTVTAAEEDYPAGGFKDCSGGPKCRGTLVGVYDESEATVD